MKVNLTRVVRASDYGPFVVLSKEKHKWAGAWQNQQNDLCAQQRLR